MSSAHQPIREIRLLLTSQSERNASYSPANQRGMPFAHQPIREERLLLTSQSDRNASYSPANQREMSSAHQPIRAERLLLTSQSERNASYSPVPPSSSPSSASSRPPCSRFPAVLSAAEVASESAPSVPRCSYACHSTCQQNVHWRNLGKEITQK